MDSQEPPALDVYVLGAGASYVHGAPLTNQILPYALSNAGSEDDERLEVVRRFLRDVFHIDPDARDVRAEAYPGLVDVLSIVDMALDRRENLARGYAQERLRQVRQALEYAIFRALEHALSYQTRSDRPRSTATRDLVKKLDPAHTLMISFNYDVIVDIALAHRFQTNFAFHAADAARLTEKNDPLGIDYGVAFANMPPNISPQSQFTLLKLHGSFNWLWSRVTGELYFGGLSKAIALLFDEPSDRALDLSGWYRGRFSDSFGEVTSDLEPLLITPTHLKDLRNRHLAVLWGGAENALRRAKQVTFIGYSLPGDDLHIKYLFKRALETRLLREAPRIVVVDYAKGDLVTSVQQNYQRFFGKGVRYYRDGFERYVREEV